jgi:hypothetical protein
MRQAVRVAAGIVLIFALIAELMSVFVEYIKGFDGSAHLIFAVVAAAGAFLVFFNVAYCAYMVLPLSLGIFFYEVYRTVSATISVYTVASCLSFFVAALLCFMLIRAHKI